MSEQEGQILHRKGERRAALSQLIASVVKRPWLTCGLALYWLWFNITFQSPMLFPSLAITSELTVPTIAAPILVCLLVYVFYSTCFRRINGLIRRKTYLALLAIFMILGAIANILWLTFGWQLVTVHTPLLEMEGGISPLALIFFCIGALFIGICTASLNVEWGRVFGALGPMQAILQSIVGYISASILSFLISLAPYPLTLVVSLLIPLPLIFCVRKTQQEFSRKQFFGHGLKTSLNIPWKLLLTALLHGICLGVLFGVHSALDSSASMVPYILVSYICAGILLLITVIAVRMDFNHLIYQVGFTIVALGSFVIVFCFPDLLIGSSIQYMGVCYIHLMMWGLCAYLTKSFKMPADWIIGLSTTCFMLGQLTAIVGSSLLAGASFSNEALPRLFLVLMLVVLVASSFMLSNRNLRTGWGIVRPGESELEGDDIALITELLATSSSLTNREGEVLVFLVKGWNRRAISDELVISEETVKSHTHNIYRKLLVNSQQELIILFETRRNALND